MTKLIEFSPLPIQCGMSIRSAGECDMKVNLESESVYSQLNYAPMIFIASVCMQLMMQSLVHVTSDAITGACNY